MANSKKEALVLCVDVGHGMVDSPNEESTSLGLSIQIISMLVQRKIFSQSKDEIALVLFGTDETANPLHQDDNDSYHNIAIAFPMGTPNFDMLNFISNQLKPGENEADFVDALTVSLDHLYKETRSKKIARCRIVMFTNFSHASSDDNLDGIIGGFNADGMHVQLDVITPDLLKAAADDSTPPSDDQPSTSRQNGNNRGRKPKSKNQLTGEDVVRRIHATGVEGDNYTLSDAVKAVTGFEKRSVNSAKWKCHLTLGTQLSIPCCAFAKTKEAKLKQSWKKCHAKTHKGGDITRNLFYFIDDEDQTEISKENLGKGYKYGKDVIPFGAEDEKQMKFAARDKCLTILGFTDRSNVHSSLHMDDQANLVMAEVGDDAAGVAMSALSTAMDQQHLCAIACYIYRRGSTPKLVVLLPRVKTDYQCLVMIGLPFAEDMRPLCMDPLLDNKPTPSDDQLQYVEDLINAMDFSSSDNPHPLFKPKEKMNLHFQRTFQCLDHRSKNPNAGLPEPNQLIQDALTLPTDVNANVLIEGLIDKFEITSTKKGEKASHDAWINNKTAESDSNTGGAEEKPVVTNISSTEVTTIGTATPVQDFLCLLDNADSNYDEVFNQMQRKIKEFAKDSFSESLKYKILECLKSFLEQVMKKNENKRAESFIIELKQVVQGSNPNLWSFFVENGIQDESTLEDLKTSAQPMELQEDEADVLLDMME